MVVTLLIINQFRFGRKQVQRTYVRRALSTLGCLKKCLSFSTFFYVVVVVCYKCYRPKRINHILYTNVRDDDYTNSTPSHFFQTKTADPTIN